MTKFQIVNILLSQDDETLMPGVVFRSVLSVTVQAPPTTTMT
jgi:hypothetical protein